jgi:polar amino acid transport system ATP-binding protein
MLKIENVSLAKNGQPILNNINMIVEPGKICFLLGSSGSGKSTLFRVLNKLEKIDQGNIFINDISFDKVKENFIGMVFQQWYVFEHMKVKDNIDLPLLYTKKITNAEERNIIIDDLLKQFDLFAHKEKYASELSGGQKQRLAICRSLAVVPTYLCLDEPTSALDPMLVRTIVNYLKNIADRGIGLLIATHDVLLLRYFENADIFFLNDGRIEEKTTYKDFLKNPAMYPFFKNYMCLDI